MRGTHEAEEQRHSAIVSQLQEQAETLNAKEREEILHAKAKRDEVRIQVDGYGRNGKQPVQFQERALAAKAAGEISETELQSILASAERAEVA